VKEIEDILRCVRLSEIPPDELEGIVKPSGLYPTREIERALKESFSLECVEESIVKQPRGKYGMFGTVVTWLVHSGVYIKSLKQG
jgi:hypothetical protein